VADKKRILWRHSKFHSYSEFAFSHRWRIRMVYIGPRPQPSAKPWVAHTVPTIITLTGRINLLVTATTAIFALPIQCQGRASSIASGHVSHEAVGSVWSRNMLYISWLYADCESGWDKWYLAFEYLTWIPITMLPLHQAVSLIGVDTRAG
jgi:hypothetical protein